MSELETDASLGGEFTAENVLKSVAKYGDLSKEALIDLARTCDEFTTPKTELRRWSRGHLLQFVGGAHRRFGRLLVLGYLRFFLLLVLLRRRFLRVVFATANTERGR